MTPNTGPESLLQGFYGVLDILVGLREADEDKLWIRIADKLAVALGAEAVSYFVVVPKSRQLMAHYAMGVDPNKLSTVPIEVGQGICGWVARHGEAALVQDAYADPRFLPDVDKVTGFLTKSILCLPIFDRLELDGVIELVNKTGGVFTKEDLYFGQSICRMASMALRTQRMETALNKVTAHNASILENLTGGFLAVDIHGKVMICNPAAKRILDIKAEIVNSPVDQALSHVAPLAEALMKTLSSRQTVKRQELSWSSEGKSRLLGYSTLLIQDPRGNLTGTGVTFQDITALSR